MRVRVCECEVTARAEGRCESPRTLPDRNLPAASAQISINKYIRMRVGRTRARPDRAARTTGDYVGFDETAEESRAAAEPLPRDTSQYLEIFRSERNAVSA